MIFEGILKAVGPLIDKIFGFIPNKNEREKAKEEFEKKLLEAMQKSAELQIELNKIEAQHPNIFVSGWRPFIGWVCGVGIAWAFMIQPIINYLIQLYGGTPINVSTDGLYQLVLAMLGMGSLRTFEKLKGVSRNNLK